MAFSTLPIPACGMTTGAAGDDVTLGRMQNAAISEAHYITQYRFVDQVIALDTATGTQNFTDQTTAVARDTGTGFMVAGGAANLSTGDAIYIRAINNAAFSKIYVRVAIAGAGAWNLRVQRFNQNTDAWETQTLGSDTTNAFRTAGSGTITFTSTVNGLERLRTGDPKYAWTKIEFIDVSSVTTSPTIDRIRVKFDQTSVVDVTVPYRDGTWPGTQWVFNEQENLVFLLIRFPGPPIGMRAIITTTDNPYATMAYEYYASDSTWKTLTTDRDPSSLLSVVGTHDIRWTRPNDWTSMTYTTPDVDGSPSTTFASTGFIMRIKRATAPTGHIYYTLGQMQLQARSFGSTSAGMPQSSAATFQYATYETSNNTSTTPVILAVANNTTGSMGRFTIAAGRASSMDDTNHRATLSANVSFAVGEELLLLHQGGGNITDMRLYLHFN